MSRHALLSASSSERWLNCPPSARLGERYEDKRSEYAAEGTEAHMLGEYKLKVALGLAAEDPTEKLKYHSEEMEDCTTGYVEYILEIIKECKEAKVLIEQRLDYSRYVKEGFGTGDCIVVSDKTLHVVDYKHGQGVLVEAEENPQMMLYALGALEIFDGIYDIETVKMTIYQPRRENISTYTVSKDSLYKWAKEVLMPIAKLAYAGEGDFKCGDWCMFCKAKHECRARADYSMELAKYDFRKPPLLEDWEVEEVLTKIDMLSSWASDIKNYALQTAIRGKKWTGYKLVEGRSNRVYSDEDLVAKKVLDAGHDPYEHKVKGITAMEKTLGKTKFNELLEGLIVKPEGKPTLVPESDKRPTMNTTVNEFKEEEQ